MAMHTRALPLVLLSILIAGCSTFPGIGGMGRPFQEEATMAEDLVSRGLYREAAEAYLRLAAKARGENAEYYRLEAAHAWLDAREPESARAALPSTVTSRQPESRLLQALARARFALFDKDYDHALAETSGQYEEVPLSANTSLRLHRTRALAYEGSGNYVEAARARIAMELYLRAPGASTDNRQRIWLLLKRIEPEVLDTMRPPPPSTLGGWMELVVLADRYGSDEPALKDALGIWASRYPGHSAALDIAPQLLETARALAVRPDHIALLLPQEGSFATAADAIRDGFLAAWYADPSPDRPRISFHPENNEDPWASYNDAVEAGAQYIVGPLAKTSVGRLADADELAVPTLALNYTPSGTETGTDAAPSPIQLIRFGLAPEDEAREVALRARYEGHSRALILHPATGWGERIAQSFATEWQGVGGRVVGTRGYGTDAQSKAVGVADLLNINLSKQRASALTAKLRRRLEFEPRRRQDADFVFLASFPDDARQLRPLLRFFHASDLPVYSTSHVYAGFADPDRDRDLDDIQFADMPWVLAPDAVDAELNDSIAAVWTDRLRSYRRLFALGADAYRVIPRIPALRSASGAGTQGLTGVLTLTEDQRIYRSLWWAQFADGYPAMLDATPPPTE